jgi:methylated-DNA-[protein]-cysteine S-methyltransferase
MNAKQWQRTFFSPVGPLTAVTGGRALTALLFDAASADAPEPPPIAQALLDATERQLADYFAGRRTAFDLPLAPAGTPFQRCVWNALLAIPYGATASYAEIARRIGQPTAMRAVGAANGRNPIAIVIPCHRVIGADGTLTGYAGGLARKQALLALEARQAFALAP